MKSPLVSNHVSWHSIDNIRIRIIGKAKDPRMGMGILKRVPGLARTLGRALLFGLAITLTGCSDQTLTGSEIRTLLNDSTVRGRHVLDNYNFERHYQPDGRFVQKPTGASLARLGEWKIKGSEICVRWMNPRSLLGPQRWLCRKIKTDGRGRYWKVVPGKSKVVVTYTSFSSQTGKDRRKELKNRSNSGGFFGAIGGCFRFFWGSPGVIVLFFLVVVFFIIGLGYEEPESWFNRNWRKYFPLKAGVFTYQYSELTNLSTPDLVAFGCACAENGRFVDIKYVCHFLNRRKVEMALPAKLLKACAKNARYREMKWILCSIESTGKERADTWCLTWAEIEKLSKTWDLLWRGVESIESDTELTLALDLIIPGDVEPTGDFKWRWNDSKRDQAGLNTLGNNKRACFLIGQAYKNRAYKTFSETEFDSNKARALLFFGKVREGADEKGEDSKYTEEVVKVYEKLMYLKFMPKGAARKVARAQSSSYQGAA
jgi:hypothetical protein